MKRVISTQAIMANGKTTYTGLFTSEGIPAEVELVCVLSPKMMRKNMSADLLPRTRSRQYAGTTETAMIVRSITTVMRR